jgi:hypothetical protein
MLTGALLVKKWFTFYDCVDKPWFVSPASWIQSTPSHTILKISFNIVVSAMRRFFKHFFPLQAL